MIVKYKTYDQNPLWLREKHGEFSYQGFEKQVECATDDVIESVCRAISYGWLGGRGYMQNYGEYFIFNLTRYEKPDTSPRRIEYFGVRGIPMAIPRTPTVITPDLNIRVKVEILGL